MPALRKWLRTLDEKRRVVKTGCAVCAMSRAPIHTQYVSNASFQAFKACLVEVFEPLQSRGYLPKDVPVNIRLTYLSVVAHMFVEPIARDHGLLLGVLGAFQQLQVRKTVHHFSKCLVALFGNTGSLQVVLGEPRAGEYVVYVEVVF